jgi:acetoin utilization protein AcuB
MIALRDIMRTEVQTAEPDMSLRDAMTMLSESHISGAPVTHAGKVVGIFSAGDLLSYITEMEEEQSEVSFRKRRTPLEDVTVADVMTREVKSLPPSCSVRTAALFMISSNIHRVLVMEAEELLGIVTTTDLAAAVAEHGLISGPLAA